MESLIYAMNPWWSGDFVEESIVREKYSEVLESNLGNRDVVLLTGLRRIGKTTLMKQQVKRLLASGVKASRVCYLSLDAYAFEGISIYDLAMKVKGLNEIRAGEKMYLFLDEVTSRVSYAQELKNLYDLGDYKIFASSSSSSLLRDKRGFLTGRSRVVVVEPLDFMEFLKFKGLVVGKRDSHLYEKYFKRYMELGGVPEYVLSEDPGYLISLVDNIIHKDIVSFNGLKNPAVIEDLFRLLCERVGKAVSYNKIGKILGISKDSVRQYIMFFRDAYLFSIVEKKGKLNERLLDDKKLYCVDVGIKNVTTGVRDFGAIFENLVFLKIKDKAPNYLKKGGIEIDFCYGDFLIEVKFGRDVEGKQKKLMDELKYKNKIVVRDWRYFLE